MATEQQDKTVGRDGAQPQVGEHDPYGHGHSPAAWTAVGIVMLGSLVMSVAVVLTSLWLFVVSVVIVVAGGVAGKVLGAMGLGAEKPSVH